MSGFRSITPGITINTESGQLRTELLNTFSRLDGQLSQAPYRIYTNNGPIGNSGSSETDLMTASIEVGTLTQIGASLLIFACGTTAANANNKTLKLYLGSSTILNTGALAADDDDWTVQAEIVFNGGTSQINWSQFLRDGEAPIVNTSTTAINMTTNQTLRFTGEATASDDISVYYWKVLLIN